MSVMRGSTDTEYYDNNYDKDYDYFVMSVAFMIGYIFWISIY
jgi:hypothetical protein